ncbi:MAG: PEP-CTERM sorting domain-containing protein, partial [Pirellulales bacterium]
WFGFSADVEPLTAPALGPGEVFALGFDVLVPAASMPLPTTVQFGAGQGESDGTPIFSGDHPVQYFTAEDSSAHFVPEPSSLGLLSGAVLALAAVRQRNGRRRLAVTRHGAAALRSPRFGARDALGAPSSGKPGGPLVASPFERVRC